MTKKRTTVNPLRLRPANTQTYAGGPVIYWMHRDHRLFNNWAFTYAQEQALTHKASLQIVFALRSDLRQHAGNRRWLSFMLAGLAEVAANAEKLKIPFSLILTDDSPDQMLSKVVKDQKAGLVVTDFSPLRPAQKWVADLAKNVPIPVVEVDAHNLVPCWVASPKAEFAARTFRPKVNTLLPAFSEEIPSPVTHPFSAHVEGGKNCFTWPFEWTAVMEKLQLARQDQPVTWLTPGREAGLRQLHSFIKDRLPQYSDKRNDPNSQVQSHLSPYLHFGQLGAQEIESHIVHETPTAIHETFLEELVVRRELSDNYCFYTPGYDAFKGFPRWAQATLDRHRADHRDFVYTPQAFEAAETHEPFWNAIQRQLITTGAIPGYLRMYWAKKILEWSAKPEEAQAIAIHLNDLYQLDGRDPNGYTGIAWSIGGVHDRPWFDRPVYGQVRYMNENGARKKFDVDTYIQRFS